ncbi:MAG: hypothetical protein AAF639_40700 [Chloroflexota bacterium]
MTIKLDPPRLSWEIGEYIDNPELPEIEQLTIVEPDFFPFGDELFFIVIFKDGIVMKIML